MSLEMTGAELTYEDKALHDTLMRLRNKVMAHSGADMMRMVSHSWQLDDLRTESGQPIVAFKPFFSDGILFLGKDLWAFEKLLHKLYGSLYRLLANRAQTNPKEFLFRKDYLDEADALSGQSPSTES
jgi:hypothetical protein